MAIDPNDDPFDDRGPTQAVIGFVLVVLLVWLHAIAVSLPHAINP
jgi:hypothetical protein